jgi:hypothetical protein
MRELTTDFCSISSRPRKPVLEYRFAYADATVRQTATTLVVRRTSQGGLIVDIQTELFTFEFLQVGRGSGDTSVSFVS